MVATMLTAGGTGPAPAWGLEAITPDWTNLEVSTETQSGLCSLTRVWFWGQNLEQPLGPTPPMQWLSRWLLSMTTFFAVTEVQQLIPRQQQMLSLLSLVSTALSSVSLHWCTQRPAHLRILGRSDGRNHPHRLGPSGGRAGPISSHGRCDGKTVLCHWRFQELIYLWLCWCYLSKGRTKEECVDFTDSALALTIEQDGSSGRVMYLAPIEAAGTFGRPDIHFTTPLNPEILGCPKRYR